MAVKDYTDPRWQRVRLRILERDGFACKACGDAKNTLHVHHRVYEKKKKIWDALDENLITLCEECHQRAEELVIVMRLCADRIIMVGNGSGRHTEFDELFHDLFVSVCDRVKIEYMDYSMEVLRQTFITLITGSLDYQKKVDE
jgi:hypothetical protein